MQERAEAHVTPAAPTVTAEWFEPSGVRWTSRCSQHPEPLKCEVEFGNPPQRVLPEQWRANAELFVAIAATEDYGGCDHLTVEMVLEAQRAIDGSTLVLLRNAGAHINHLEAAVCGEWHMDNWPECDHPDHEVGLRLLEAIGIPPGRRPR